MSAEWYLSQAFMLIGLGVAIAAFQVKRKVHTLLALGVACVFQAISTGLLLNWVAFSIAAVAMVRSFTFAFIEHRAGIDKPIAQGLQHFFVLTFMTAMVITISITWERWFDFALLAASLLLIYGNYAKGTHLIRIATIIFEAFLIVNHAVFFNIAGIIFSSLMIFAIFIYYARFLFSKRYRLQRLYTEQASPDIPSSQATFLPQGSRGNHTQLRPKDIPLPE